MDDPVIFSEPNPAPVSLFRELNRFRMTGAFCDAVLATNDGASFRVHRVPMSLCGSFFRALFTTKLVDESAGDGPRSYFLIPNVSSSVLETIIKYAYSGVVDVNNSNLNELLPAADEFGVSGIVDECVNFMLKNMSNQNCIGVWRFAVDYYMPQLKDNAYKFILANFDDISVNSKEFLHLKLNNIRDILSDNKLNTASEQLVWIAIKRWCQYKYAKRHQYIPSLLTCVRMALLPMKDFEQIVNDPRVYKHVPCRYYINIVSNYFLHEVKEISQINCDRKSLAMFTPRHPYQMIFVSGGWALNGPTNTFEVYDCRADMWKAIFFGNYNNRVHHQVVSIGKYIYVIGGCTDEGIVTNTCWRIDTSDFTRKEICPMQERRSYFGVVVLNGKIYVIGGYDGDDRMRTAECYDDALNQWSHISPMNEKRTDAGASSLRNRIFVVGGHNGEHFLQSAECYFAEYDQWFLLPSMMKCRSGLGCVVLDNYVYAIGGFNGIRRLESVERYSIKHRQWNLIKHMEKARNHFGVAVMENKIYVIGGYDDGSHSATDNVECYDPTKNQWRRIAYLNIGRKGCSACTLSEIHVMERFIRDDTVRCLLK